MGVGAGLYMCDLVKKFTFAISSPDEFLYISGNGNECPPQVSYLLAHFICDVNMTSLSRSWHWLMSCDSVCCMCGESSRWLMTQLTIGHHACVLVIVPIVCGTKHISSGFALWQRYCTAL